MTIRCVACGKFLSYRDLDDAEYHFEPDSHKGPEVSEWTCLRCLKKEGRYNFTVWDVAEGNILEAVYKVWSEVLDQLRESYNGPQYDIVVEDAVF